MEFMGAVQGVERAHGTKCAKIVVLGPWAPVPTGVLGSSAGMLSLGGRISLNSCCQSPH